MSAKVYYVLSKPIDLSSPKDDSRFSTLLRSCTVGVAVRRIVALDGHVSMCYLH